MQVANAHIVQYPSTLKGICLLHLNYFKLLTCSWTASYGCAILRI